MSFNAVLGFITWCLLLLAALHSMFLRKKLGEGFMALHYMDVLFAFAFATVHGGIILNNIITNGWPIKLGALLGILTWSLVFLALLFGIFRKPLAAALKKAYMPVHMLLGILAFLMATTHGGFILYNFLNQPPK
jgi:hypothetical protein